MRFAHMPYVIAAALAGALAVTSAHAQTPDSVETRLGTLNFEQGFPTEETTRKVFDEMDYQRAVQAYLWAYPAVSFESIRIGMQTGPRRRLNDLIIADNFAEPKGIWLTANDTTIYAWRTSILGSRDRSSSKSRPGHRRPDRRLLAARDHRRRPARSRRRQGRQVSSPAARLQGRGSEGGLPRPAGDDEQLQRHGPRHRQNWTTTSPAR